MMNEKKKVVRYRNAMTENWIHAPDQTHFAPGDVISNPEKHWPDWPSQKAFFEQIGAIEEIKE